MIRHWINLVIIGLVLGSGSVNCKKKNEGGQQNSQILGTRYSRFWHQLTTTPGGKEKVKVDSSKEKSPLVSVLEFEEVTVLEKVTQDNKDYYKVRTVTGQEGYGEAKNYAEAFYVAISSGSSAFKKPTVTAGTRGNLDTGAYCAAKEIQGEWANVDCFTAKYKQGSGIEDWYDVWIQINDGKLIVDPLLNETAKLYREVLQAYDKIDKGAPDSDKLQKSAQEKLNRALEKNDVLNGVVRNFMIQRGLLTEETMVAPPSEDLGNQKN